VLDEAKFKSRSAWLDGDVTKLARSLLPSKHSVFKRVAMQHDGTPGSLNALGGPRRPPGVKADVSRAPPSWVRAGVNLMKLRELTARVPDRLRYMCVPHPGGVTRHSTCLVGCVRHSGVGPRR
jgi:hypothetical protein